MSDNKLIKSELNLEERVQRIEDTLAEMAKALQNINAKLESSQVTNQQFGALQEKVAKSNELQSSVVSQVFDLNNQINGMKYEISNNDILIKNNVGQIATVVEEITLNKFEEFKQSLNKLEQGRSLDANIGNIVAEKNVVSSNGTLLTSVENALKWKEVRRKNKEVQMLWVYRVERIITVFASQIKEVHWNVLKNEALNTLFEESPHAMTGVSMVSLQHAWEHFKRVEGLTAEKLSTIMIGGIVMYERKEQSLRDDLIKFSGLLEYALDKSVVLPSVNFLKAKVKDWIPASNWTNSFRSEISPIDEREFLLQLLEQISCLDASVKGRGEKERENKVVKPLQRHDEKPKGEFIDPQKWKSLSEEEKKRIIAKRQLK
eukprot:GDKJ01053525.1.p1 GENE.GDKJ01053525.1~~GDKJ01053525.1.p1  ORF type:complete len:375 (+),score=62.12 GDKJ01053525.1:77-1201(+)